MLSAAQPGDVAAPAGGDRSPGWCLAARVVFRFCVVYFGLFCLLFPQIMFVFTGIVAWVLPPDAVVWQMTALGPVTEWVGRHVFGVDAALHPDSRSGDQTAMWVLMFIVVVIALTATVIWSVADRRRRAYPRLHAWFLLFVRICLGGQMLFYGAIKVIPVQMPAPPLTSLLRPYGSLSPTWVLWLQVGGSYPYEIALGVVELVAGVLLFWPRTATLGALLAVAAMADVFVLNMTFDVSVKILSFQLLGLAVVLLAPQAKRLANMLILETASPPATQPALLTNPRATKITTAFQVALGAWVLVGSLSVAWLDWRDYGGGAPKPELYGIWAVTEFSLDGTVLPPLTTQQDRWQRVVIEDPDKLTYQRMDGELVTVPAVIGAHRISVFDAPGLAVLAVERPGPDRLALSGHLNRRPVTMTLKRFDLDRFPLRSHRFHWVQQYPDNPLER
ncbi:MAG TPA: DoxX family protein [Mycobacterium sp.]|nr:DoxX family protein [Mycobacterium sp.]